MKRFSRSRILSICRMTGFILLLSDCWCQKGDSSESFVARAWTRDYIDRRAYIISGVNTSAAAWWCQWLCRKWVKRVSCSWSQAPKWTATTTALVCSDKVCCRISQPSTCTEVHRWQYQPVEASPVGYPTGEWWTCWPEVQLAVDICTLALLFVADVIRDELFAGVQHTIFFLRQSCWSYVAPSSVLSVCYDKICITPLVVVCSLHVPKIIEFYHCIQMLPAKM